MYYFLLITRNKFCRIFKIRQNFVAEKNTGIAQPVVFSIALSIIHLIICLFHPLLNRFQVLRAVKNIILLFAKNKK